jgi:hypothetical protein
MEVALVVLVVLGAFILGGVVIWSVKDHVDAFIDNAAYAKAVTHPEMLDEDGNVLRDELIYIRPDNSIWEDWGDEEEDED